MVLSFGLILINILIYLNNATRFKSYQKFFYLLKYIIGK